MTQKDVQVVMGVLRENFSEGGETNEMTGQLQADTHTYTVYSFNLEC